MFKRISMKTISATAMSLSFLASALVSSGAFAKVPENKTISAKNSDPVVTRHTRRLFVFEGASKYFQGEFRRTNRLGNRSISHR